LTRILYINPEGHTGLAYTDHSLCNALETLGHEVTLLTCKEYPLWSLPRQFRAVPQYQGKADNKMCLALTYVMATIRLIPFAIRYTPDIIHFEVLRIPLADIPILLLLRCLGFPVVLNVHDAIPLEKSLLRMTGYRWTYHIADHLTVYANATRQDLVEKLGVPKDKVTVLTHGHYCDFISQDSVDSKTARVLLGLAPDDHVILFFGVLRESKGLDTLLWAMPRILEHDAKAKLLIAGKPRRPEELNTYRHLISRLDLEDAVVLEDRFVPDDEVERVFAASDVVALPYRKAYYSGVIKLAYSHGKAVVASNVGGLAELLKEGETGYFSEPNNPDDLADKLLGILEDDESRYTMGLAAEQWVRAEYDWIKTARQLDAAYKRLLPTSRETA
jgi:glycosyltransferase involved in cell wall biosynthesis